MPCLDRHASSTAPQDSSVAVRGSCSSTESLKTAQLGTHRPKASFINNSVKHAGHTTPWRILKVPLTCSRWLHYSKLTSGVTSCGYILAGLPYDLNCLVGGSRLPNPATLTPPPFQTRFQSDFFFCWPTLFDQVKKVSGGQFRARDGRNYDL